MKNRTDRILLRIFLVSLVVYGLLLLSFIGYQTVRGWDILGFMIALSLSIAPVVGCVLAWAVYGVQCLLGGGKNPPTPRN